VGTITVGAGLQSFTKLHHVVILLFMKIGMEKQQEKSMYEIVSDAAGGDDMSMFSLAPSCMQYALCASKVLVSSCPPRAAVGWLYPGQTGGTGNQQQGIRLLNCQEP
jgi:hypothetical protein